MTAAAFDTLTAAEALQQAGIAPTQAKAIVAVLRDAVGAGRSEPATGADLADIRSELAALETRMTWRMAGVMAALLTVQGALTVALLQPAAS